MSTRIFHAFLLTAGFAFAQPATTPPAAAKPKPVAPAATPAAKPAAPAPVKPKLEPGLYAIISVMQGTAPMGDITVKLFEQESPITVKNFTDLAQGRKPWVNPKTGQKMVGRPLYNGLTFHRVIPGFMIQGGDPLGTGTGGTEAIKDEFHPSLKFDAPGRLAMANAGPGTGSCQFFITEVPTPHLNGRHTIFGQVVDGQELVSKITRLPRAPNDMPNVPVKMSRVTIRKEGAPAPAVVKPAPAKPAPAKPAVAPAKPAVSPAKPATPPAKPAAATPAPAKPAAPKPAAPKPAAAKPPAQPQ